MDCPPHIARVVLQILRWGALRARAAGWSGDARRAAVEADHIHNLPGLLLDYLPGRLRYYLDAERPGYLKAIGGSPDGEFARLWAELDEAAAS